MGKIFAITILIRLTVVISGAPNFKDTQNFSFIEPQVERSHEDAILYSKKKKDLKLTINSEVDIKINAEGDYNAGFIQCISTGSGSTKSIRAINCPTLDNCGSEANLKCLQSEECAGIAVYSGDICGSKSTAMTTSIDPNREELYDSQNKCVNISILIDNLNPGGIVACDLAEAGTVFEFFALGADLQYQITSDNQSWIPLALWVGNEQVLETKNFSLGDHIMFGCYATKFLYTEELHMGVVYEDGLVEYNDDDIVKEDNGYFWSILKMIKILENMDGIACKTFETNGSQMRGRLVEEKFRFEIVDSILSPPDRNQDHKGLNYGLSIGISVAFIIIFLVIALLLFWRKYKRAKESLRNLSPEEVEEFQMGSPRTISQQKGDGSESHELAASMPFDPSHEIPATFLVIDKHSILGQGQFGTVFEGTLGGNQRVAVKTTKAHADLVYFKALLSEIKVMAYIGRHENIVQFLGAQTTQIEKRMAYLVFELSPHGDLCSWLKLKRRELESDDQLVKDAAYVDLEMLKRFTSQCRQIANAMSHLESKKLMHGDLAARNILVFDNNVVKVSDFGLSRRLYDYSKYFKKQKVALPWRWMPPEGLLYNEFSTKSDVWSFGIVVWEIFTYGAIPYADETWSLNFMERLKSGLRLNRPALAPQMMYTVFTFSR